jgi:dipeptidyl aminopeptidase/acylaminoacyl peptidase
LGAGGVALGKAAWERISPYNDVAKITTPTLWMDGSDDWNVPILNSEQMYLGMKRLGRETQLVVYPDEYHGLKRPSFKRPYERYLDWLKKQISLIPVKLKNDKSTSNY